MNIALKSLKIFLSYFTITLLNQKMNDLSLAIVDEKLKIIFKLKIFSYTKALKNLFRKD